MGWFIAALTIVVIGFAFFIGLGRGGQMAPQIEDRPGVDIPPEGQPITDSDLRALKFSVVPRGYSMEQVDAVLDRLGKQLSSDGESLHCVSSASRTVTNGDGSHAEADADRELTDDSSSPEQANESSSSPSRVLATHKMDDNAE